MARTRDPAHIPRAGLEIGPIAVLASINVNVSAVPATGFVGEPTFGSGLCHLPGSAQGVAYRSDAS